MEGQPTLGTLPEVMVVVEQAKGAMRTPVSTARP